MEQNMKNNGLLGGVLLAAVTASLCCILPLLFAGAGVTAIVVAEKFAAIRPYMLAVTALLLAAGFYYAYHPGKESCEPGDACATPASRRRARLGLWLATGVALVLTTFPYWSGAVIRGVAQTSQASLDLRATAVPLQKTTLQISGMVCEMCAALIEKELEKQPGVRSARVLFSESRAEVEYDPSAISLSRIRSLIEKAGYQVVVAASDVERNG